MSDTNIFRRRDKYTPPYKHDRREYIRVVTMPKQSCVFDACSSFFMQHLKIRFKPGQNCPAKKAMVARCVLLANAAV